MRKNIVSLLGIALASSMNAPMYTGKRSVTSMDDLPSRENQKHKEEENLILYKKSKGMKEFEFNFGGVLNVKVWARNHKNAVRKANLIADNYKKENNL